MSPPPPKVSFYSAWCISCSSIRLDISKISLLCFGNSAVEGVHCFRNQGSVGDDREGSYGRSRPCLKSTLYHSLNSQGIVRTDVSSPPLLSFNCYSALLNILLLLEHLNPHQDEDFCKSFTFLLVKLQSPFKHIWRVSIVSYDDRHKFPVTRVVKFAKV